MYWPYIGYDIIGVNAHTNGTNTGVEDKDVCISRVTGTVINM